MFLIFIITIPIILKANTVLIVFYKFLIDVGNILTNIEENAPTFLSFDKITNPKFKVDYFWYIELVLNIGTAIRSYYNYFVPQKIH